jgi:hypothetical protein
MQRYEPDLGILTFKIIDMNLTKSDLRSGQWIDYDPKARNVHAEELVVTLRSLVTSTLSFDNAKPSTADSCTIAAAFKFVGKEGRTFGCSGVAEKEVLQRVKDRYAEHGLDY